MNISMVLLSLSTLISSAGTTLLVSALALSLFDQDASALKASGVYIAQFLPAIFLLPLAVRTCNNHEPRKGLILAEVASAISTILLGFFIQLEWLFMGYCILAIRGFLEIITKTFRSVSVKNFAIPSKLEKSNNLVMGGSFLGQALGALAGFFLGSKISILHIALIDGLTFLVSALLCSGIVYACVDAKPAANDFKSSWAGLLEIRNNPRIRLYFIYLSWVVIIFQSYNQIARTWIPLAWLDFGLEKGITGELIGCGGILVGLLIANSMPALKINKNILIFLSIFFTCSFLSAPFATKDPVTSLFFYFVYMVFFEIGFMVSMNSLLVACPKHRVASVMSIFYAFSFGGLTVSGLLIAYSTDLYRLPVVSLILALISFIFLLGIHVDSIFSKTKRRTSESGSRQ